MISKSELERQLKRIDFNPKGWGKTEAMELCNILMPEEEIKECVNGYYEAGFALLVATNERVLLIDKKPLNYLTVEDLRFDMISEFDYSHRLIGAHACISSSGNKTLNFTSMNQKRLRNLITIVQTRMTELKKISHQQQETQQEHLKNMNEQLRDYLIQAQEQALQQQQQQLAALQQQQATAERLRQAAVRPALPQPSFQNGPVRSAAEFESLAAQNMDALVGTPAEQLLDGDRPQLPAQVEASPTAALRRAVPTPQQLSLAAVRRAAPFIRAYSRSPFGRHRATPTAEASETMQAPYGSPLSPTTPTT